MRLSQNLSFSLSWLLPTVTSCPVTQQSGYGDRWTNQGRSQLAEVGRGGNRRFTAAHLPSGALPTWVSRPFGRVYVSVRVCVLVVLLQRWFENLQLNRQVLLVKAGKSLWFIPESSCAEYLADSNLFQ